MNVFSVYQVFTKCLPSVYPSVEIAKPVSITYYFLLID